MFHVEWRYGLGLFERELLRQLRLVQGLGWEFWPTNLGGVADLMLLGKFKTCGLDECWLDFRLKDDALEVLEFLWVEQVQLDSILIFPMSFFQDLNPLMNKAIQFEIFNSFIFQFLILAPFKEVYGVPKDAGMEVLWKDASSDLFWNTLNLGAKEQKPLFAVFSCG